MGCFADRACAFFGDIARRAAADRLNRFSVFPEIVCIEILPVPVLLVIDNPGKLIYLELLVLGGMGIVECLLFEWNISANKFDQPAILLIKQMT